MSLSGVINNQKVLLEPFSVLAVGTIVCNPTLKSEKESISNRSTDTMPKSFYDGWMALALAVWIWSRIVCAGSTIYEIEGR